VAAIEQGSEVSVRPGASELRLRVFSAGVMAATALGASAALGVLLSFAVIIRALRRPAARRSPLLNRLLEATANRDFSVLLLALAIFGRIDLFLWMAGIGIHIFWIALLLLLWGPAHRSISATVHRST